MASAQTPEPIRKSACQLHPVCRRSRAAAFTSRCVGIVFACVVGFFIYGLVIYRNLDWRRLVAMLIETVSLSGSIHYRRCHRHGLGHGCPAARPPSSVSILTFVILGSVLEGIAAIVPFGLPALPDRPGGRGA